MENAKMKTTRMELEMLKAFEVISKKENGFEIETIFADTMANACAIADGLYRGWRYVSEVS